MMIARTTLVAAMLMAALSASAQTANDDEADYAGAEACKTCHAKKTAEQDVPQLNCSDEPPARWSLRG